MKGKRLMVSVMVLAGLVIAGASCSTLMEGVTAEHLTWSFFQVVGGIKVGDPQVVAPGEWTMPVECDVSGLTTVTTKPTAVNSALVVQSVRWKAQQDMILVWVIACVVTDQHREPHWTRSITLKGLKPGTYSVEYLNPDGSTAKLRSIELRETVSR